MTPGWMAQPNTLETRECGPALGGRSTGVGYLPLRHLQAISMEGTEGNNLFGEALVCVDLKTGQRNGTTSWCITRYGTWTSLLRHTCRHHCRRQADQSCGAATKQGFLYVFDRVTGQPVWQLRSVRWSKATHRRMVFSHTAVSHEATGLQPQRRVG